MEIPVPHIGLVVRYEYLWRAEYEKYMENGTKDRPCVVVLIKKNSIAFVAPITHTCPEDESIAIEVPRKTLIRLGLGSEKSWIICSELNQFKWPGTDLRPIPKKGTALYGTLPPELFQKIKTKIAYLSQGRSLKIVARSGSSSSDS